MNKYYPHLKIPFIQLENYQLCTDTVKIIPEEMARHFQVVALDKLANILTLGMANPENEESINILEDRLKLKITPIKVDIQEWANAVNNNYLEEE